MRGTEQQLVYAGLALMQYAIEMNRKDSEALEVLTKTAQNLVQLYLTGKVSGITAIVEAPTRAYLQAIGAE